MFGCERESFISESPMQYRSGSRRGGFGSEAGLFRVHLFQCPTGSVGKLLLTRGVWIKPQMPVKMKMLPCWSSLSLLTLFFTQFPKYMLAFWAETGLQAPVPSLFGLVVNLHVQDIPCSFFMVCLHFALFCESILFDLILNSLLSPREESAVVSEDIQK